LIQPRGSHEEETKSKTKQSPEASPVGNQGVDLQYEEASIVEEEIEEEEKPRGIEDDALPDASKTSGSKFVPPGKNKFKVYNPIVVSNF